MPVLLFAVILLILLTGCTARYNIARESFKDRPPLDSKTPVTIIYASEVPVLPQNLELVATMGDIYHQECFLDYIPSSYKWTKERLTEWARKFGASVIYVKCIERSVEFLAKKSGGKNEKN